MGSIAHSLQSTQQNWVDVLTVPLGVTSVTWGASGKVCFDVGADAATFPEGSYGTDMGDPDPPYDPGAVEFDFVSDLDSIPYLAKGGQAPGSLAMAPYSAVLCVRPTGSNPGRELIDAYRLGRGPASVPVAPGDHVFVGFNDNKYGDNSGTFSLLLTWAAPSPPALEADYACPASGTMGSTTFSVALNWGAVSGAGGYRLYRDGVEIYAGALLAYTDTGRTLGTEYSYTVIAYNESGESVESGAVEVLCCAPPGAPTGLRAAYCGCCGGAVSWEEPSTGYQPMTYTLTRNGWVVYQGAAPIFHDSSADRYAESEYAVTATNACGTGIAATTTLAAQWSRRPGCSGTEYDRRDSVESVYGRRGAVSTEYGRRDQCDCG